MTNMMLPRPLLSADVIVILGKEDRQGCRGKMLEFVRQQSVAIRGQISESLSDIMVSSTVILFLSF